MRHSWVISVNIPPVSDFEHSTTREELIAEMEEYITSAVAQWSKGGDPEDWKWDASSTVRVRRTTKPHA